MSTTHDVKRTLGALAAISVLGACASETDPSDPAPDDPASAEPETTGTTEEASTVAAPSCVTYKKTYRYESIDSVGFTVYNRCPHWHGNVTLDVKWQHDPPCQSIGPHQTKRFWTQKYDIAHWFGDPQIRKVKICGT